MRDPTPGYLNHSDYAGMKKSRGLSRISENADQIPREAMRDHVSHHIHRAAVASAKRFPLNEDAIRDVLSMTREARASHPGAFRRASPRFELDAKRIMLSVVHPGGSVACSKCIMLDISAGGASLLYPGFLHARTECVLHTNSLDGESVMLPAEIVWCRFVTKSIHSIGLRWDKEIDPRLFIPSKEWLEQMSTSDGLVKAELNGRLLAVGINEIERDLISLYLDQTSIEMISVDFGGAAFDQFRKQSFDIIVIDADCPECAGDDLVTRLRAEGFTEPIVLLMDQRAITAPPPDKTVTILPKPFTKDDLLAVLRDLILANANPFTGSRPIRTELDLTSALVPAISAYIAKLRGFTTSLNAAITADRADEAAKILLTVRNTASGYGFPVLVEAAGLAITSVNASGSAEESAAQIRLLIRMINRLEDPRDALATAD